MKPPAPVPRDYCWAQHAHEQHDSRFFARECLGRWFRVWMQPGKVYRLIEML